MYRLTDDLAAHRRLYRAPILTSPDVMVIDVPNAFRGQGLAMGRYYPIFVETSDELRELENFLSTPRDGAVRPDLLDQRSSSSRTSQLVIARYEPPDDGWPWLSVCCWPELGSSFPSMRGEMARGCYTMEMFESASLLEVHEFAMLKSLGRGHDLEV